MKRRVKKDVCPTCGQGRLSPRLANRTWKTKDRGSVVVRGVLVWACDKCDEQAVDYEELERAEKIAKLLSGTQRHAAG